MKNYEDNIFNKISNTINKHIKSLNKELLKISKGKLHKIGKALQNKIGEGKISSLDLILNKFHVSDNKEYDLVVDKYRKIIKKDLKKYTSRELETLSSTLGVKLNKLNFIKLMDSTVDLGLTNLSNDIKRDLFNYTRLNYITDLDDKFLLDFSKKINKTLNETSSLLKETSIRTIRHTRKVVYEKYAEEGQLFMYVGASDSRNSDFCARYVGQIKNKQEWEAIKPDIFTAGGHYGCRHALVPVDSKDL